MAVVPCAAISARRSRSSAGRWDEVADDAGAPHVTAQLLDRAPEASKYVGHHGPQSKKALITVTSVQRTNGRPTTEPRAPVPGMKNSASLTSAGGEVLRIEDVRPCVSTTTRTRC